MTAAPESHHPAPPDREPRKGLAILAFLAGVAAVFIIVRQMPPPPPFSPELGRATYWQSYESSYFASLRSYETLIAKVIARGEVPVVVFGDSTIRGSGATRERVWTSVLEDQLRVANPRIRVLNFAQNAGDLMGPFLYHHLHERFPDAYYIVQWHFASEVGVRHPFHYWLTSEIALRDGKRNPAVRRSLSVVPVAKPEERSAFVMAALNIATNYLDVGNWVRYRWLGRMEFASDRTVKVRPLLSAPDNDVDYAGFKAPAQADTIAALSKYFRNHLDHRRQYVLRPFAEREAYFAEMYPTTQRARLLVLTLDLNPYYAPTTDKELMDTWRDNWKRLRADMALIPDLRWVSLTGADGGLQVDDFLDLGHLTVGGQRRVAETVAANLIGPGGWFDPAAPGSEPRPASLADHWINTQDLPAYQLEPFRYLSPVPTRFFSSFGPSLDADFLSVHPTTRLCFDVPAGEHRLRTTLRFAPGAYEDNAEGQCTDGVTLELALVGPGDRRTVVCSRLVDPARVIEDRARLPITIPFTTGADDEVELSIGPGPSGHATRDWVFLGPLTIE
jgi:hypothetical protein